MKLPLCSLLAIGASGLLFTADEKPAAAQFKDTRDNKAGEEWLAANAKKPGVKTMPDGFQYKVLVTGKGPQPKASDTVSAHYKGMLTDGTEFDSSYSRGQPLTRPVMTVIAGWQEALTNMHVGDKWELYVPGTLGYGERGSPPKIGPGATLVFEMELLGIEPPQTNGPSFTADWTGIAAFAPGVAANAEKDDWKRTVAEDKLESYLRFQESHPNTTRVRIFSGSLTAQPQKVDLGGTFPVFTTSSGVLARMYGQEFEIGDKDARRLGLVKQEQETKIKDGKTFINISTRLQTIQAKAVLVGDVGTYKLIHIERLDTEPSSR